MAKISLSAARVIDIFEPSPSLYVRLSAERKASQPRYIRLNSTSTLSGITTGRIVRLCGARGERTKH